MFGTLQIFLTNSFSESAEIWAMGKFEDIWCRDGRHEQRTLAQGALKNRRDSRSRRGNEAELFFAPKSASSRRRLPFLEHTLIVATVLLIDLSFASARIDWNRPGQLCAPGPIHQRR